MQINGKHYIQTEDGVHEVTAMRALTRIEIRDLKRITIAQARDELINQLKDLPPVIRAISEAAGVPSIEQLSGSNGFPRCMMTDLCIPSAVTKVALTFDNLHTGVSVTTEYADKLTMEDEIADRIKHLSEQISEQIVESEPEFVDADEHQRATFRRTFITGSPNHPVVRMVVSGVAYCADDNARLRLN